MGSKPGLFLTALAALVGGGVWLSWQLDRVPSMTAATDAALRIYDPILFEVATPETARAEGIDYWSLCLDATFRVDIDQLAELLSDTALRAFDANDCIAERVPVESGFSKDSYVLHWHDPNGRSAFYYFVRNVHCINRSKCRLEIGGDTRVFDVTAEEIDRVWTVEIDGVIFANPGW